MRETMSNAEFLQWRAFNVWRHAQELAMKDAE